MYIIEKVQILTSMNFLYWIKITSFIWEGFCSENLLITLDLFKFNTPALKGFIKERLFNTLKLQEFSEIFKEEN